MGSNIKLYDESANKEFYENLFINGYMEDWTVEKKKLIQNEIKNLKLPEFGTVLDFGCGNGIFTDILKTALPKWQIYGCDISEKAVENAQKTYPECKFFLYNDSALKSVKFDFIFSHHVLEHVYNLEIVLNELNDLTKKSAICFHVLPCGNSGSFEHYICTLNRNGIDPAIENRFFYEDEGHLRRLTSAQLTGKMEKYGFKLKSEYYSNQFFGAMKWITQGNYKVISDFTRINNAKDSKSAIFLFFLKFLLSLLYYTQKPAVLMQQIIRTRNKHLKHYLFIIIGSIPAILSSVVNVLINILAEFEWKSRKDRRNGSEMYLIFERK